MAHSENSYKISHADTKIRITVRLRTMHDSPKGRKRNSWTPSPGLQSRIIAKPVDLM